MRHLADGRGRSPIDDFHVAWLQFDGCAIAFHAATADRLAPTFEKVREAISKACGYTCDDREQPCTIPLNEVWLVLDALDGARDHGFTCCTRFFSSRVTSRTPSSVSRRLINTIGETYNVLPKGNFVKKQEFLTSVKAEASKNLKKFERRFSHLKKF